MARKVLRADVTPTRTSGEDRRPTDSTGWLSPRKSYWLRPLLIATCKEAAT